MNRCMNEWSLDEIMDKFGSGDMGKCEKCPEMQYRNGIMTCSISDEYIEESVKKNN